MNSLATCKPSEFLRQCNRVRKSAAKWMNDTQIMEIRKRMPTIPAGGLSPDELKQANLRQAQENINAMLESVMEVHPDETLELLALCCFVEPENVDDHPIDEYLGAFADMISNENVLRFFTSLLKLGQMNI